MALGRVWFEDVGRDLDAIDKHYAPEYVHHGAEGDLVVTRLTSRGTLTGACRGIEPTGKEWVTEGICISRIDNGRIAKNWKIIRGSGL